ncbi:hypothetical protein [Novipirellula rosea]|uniref:Transposase n=1 Tax=Novipirellula rosea TaxID=1031540 RepID=A0ABP8NDF5_9BACT
MSGLRGKHPPEVVQRVRDLLRLGTEVQSIVDRLHVSKSYVKSQRAILKKEAEAKAKAEQESHE